MRGEEIRDFGGFFRVRLIVVGMTSGSDHARHRYGILVDGERAGLTAYRDRGEQRVFHHTEVGDAFAGQGLAALLVERALTDVRDSGKRMVPVCSYVAKFVEKHGEFADITDPVTPDVLRWLEAELD